MIHEDERRTLEDWPEAKIITAKKDCILGQHSHKIKTEKFILTKGKCIVFQYPGNDAFQGGMKIGKMYTINPMTYHEFHLSKGSVLIGLCSHVFDPTDDYK